KKYLRTKAPLRPCKGPPQVTHVISRSVVGRGGASTRTISYFVPQLGQSNRTDGESDISRRCYLRGGREDPALDGPGLGKSHSFTQLSQQDSELELHGCSKF